MKNKLTIGYFYKNQLNLYGDNGNVEILFKRAKERDIDVSVLEIDTATNLTMSLASDINLIFMGGGPDSAQKEIYEDLLKNKGRFLKDYIDNFGIGLYVCGAYQLLGQYYKAADGSIINGLDILHFYTKSLGNKKPRCIGNVVSKINSVILNDSVFQSLNHLDDLVVGFENHGGRTYLSEGENPFGNIVRGSGNNSEDGTEGVFYKGTLGTYLHGPLLSKNPHIADYLIAKALNRDSLSSLDDTLINTAHHNAAQIK